MNKLNKKKIFKVFKLIFFISLIIAIATFFIHDSKAEEATVVGNNNGYGMITVNYHSNYLAKTAANGGKATEVVYSITTPIYINSKGEYCISLGEYKFAEKQVSSDGVTEPNEDANAIDTGFRGYTLSANPSGMRDSSGFWVGKATGSNGPDNIPDEVLANTYNGVKRIFNDWEDGIYQQGDELVLNSSNLSGYNNIEYSATYDTNRNGGTGKAGDTRNTYTLDVYAQWVKANIYYVASTSTDAKATSLNTTFGVSNITKAKIKTNMTGAIGAVKVIGESMYENYIVITDKSANSSMGYEINIVENKTGNGFTATSKYFGVDTSGRLLLKGDMVLKNDWRFRNIDFYSANNGNMGTNNFYSRGNMIIMEYGIREYVGSTATEADKNEVTNKVFDDSNADTRGCFNINVDGYEGFSISRVTYSKVLSGHVFRYLIDRWSPSAYINKYVYYNVGGTARVDLLLAGPAQGTLQFCKSFITIKDTAIVDSLYGGNQGHKSANYLALECSSYLNIYGNANITTGIFGGGGGRAESIPFFSGDVYINVCGGNVETIYGAGASNVIIPKSDGEDSNIYMNILGGKINTIYGAGNGMNYDATGVVTTFGALNGSLTGNVNINIKNATIGNVYGGGEGYNEEASSKGCAYRDGDATITIGKGAIITGNVYGGGKGFSTHPKATSLSSISKTVTWDSSGNEYTYKIRSDLLSKISYIETASVIDGLTTINIIENAIVKGNVYGGGQYAGTTSTEKITVNIEDGTIVGDVFGGGYSGPVEGDVDIDVLKGTFSNIYGGADKSYVAGNTQITIGNEDDLGITVSGLVYGGGKGVDSDGDGDASDYITVNGSSNVTIEGINTMVQNYGSVKLGAVSGTADILFKNYWTGNSTAKYKTMNGIDRATTVTFDNSYVLLENKDENGNLSGIKAIGTLVIPDGSGLKISADGEITEDFIGGGEIYLDSGISLTVGGDISDVTKITINPVFSTEYNAKIIEGGIENPYVIVKGNSLATDEEAEAIELVSGEKRYSILAKNVEQTTSDKDAYYYLVETIVITNNVAVDSLSNKDRIYTGGIEDVDAIEIKNREVFTSQIKLTYELSEDNSAKAQDDNKYNNLSRYFTIKKSHQELVTIPAGTEIMMKIDDIYYTYLVKEDTTQIPLTNFKDEENNNYFGGFKNLREEVEGVYDQVTNTTLYTTDETYRFIVDFKEVENPIDNDRYYSMINVNDDSVWVDENQVESANIIIVENREYDYSYNLNQEEYDGEDCINISGNLSIGESPDKNENNLNLKIKLLNSEGTSVKIPDGIRVELNGNEYYVKDGVFYIEYLENVPLQESMQELNLKLDMEGILPQNRLTDGEYEIVIELIDNETEIIEEKFLIPVVIENIERTDYGLKAEIVGKTGLAENANQIIKKENNEQREIELIYNATLQNTKVKIKALERISEFEYEETENSKKIVTQINDATIFEITEVEPNQTILVNFETGITEGTYRIVFELYDKYDKKITETFVNFIVL